MSESCLRFSESQKSWNFTVTREKFHSDLMRIGFSNKKSYDTTTVVWNNIPEKFKKDFLLGLWDGDGSFFVSKDKKQGTSLISNNDILLDSIVSYINYSLGKDFCKKKERTKGDPYPRIRIGYNKAKIFGDWLYSNITYPVLQRKYNIYSQFHIGQKKHPGIKNSRAKGIICIDNGHKYATAKECCLGEFGVDNAGAQNCSRAVCRGERSQTRGKHFRYMTEEEKEEMRKNE